MAKTNAAKPQFNTRALLKAITNPPTIADSHYCAAPGLGESVIYAPIKVYPPGPCYAAVVGPALEATTTLSIRTHSNGLKNSQNPRSSGPPSGPDGDGINYGLEQACPAKYAAATLGELTCPTS